MERALMVSSSSLAQSLKVFTTEFTNRYVIPGTVTAWRPRPLKLITPALTLTAAVHSASLSTCRVRCSASSRHRTSSGYHQYSSHPKTMERALMVSSSSLAQSLKVFTTEFTNRYVIPGTVTAWRPRPPKLITPALTLTAAVHSASLSTCRVRCSASSRHRTSSGYHQASVNNKVLKLVSGSSYLPHPDKEERGGEDAHFFLTEEQAIGVADGVGGWAEEGINAGDYARELMANSVVAIQQEPESFIDPARVLEKAYLGTKSQGSSTACILALSDRGLHAANLGDSGFIVIRGGHTLFRSPIQQHSFNCCFQLQSGDGADLPSSAQTFTIHVAHGDVIIAGTDGLFDNLYDGELSALVVDAIGDSFGAQTTAETIAASARQRALDKDRDTPFSDAAQRAGYWYRGGKLDDITVVVSYVTAMH